MKEFQFYISGLDRDVWAQGETQRQAHDTAFAALSSDEQDEVEYLECIDQRDYVPPEPMGKMPDIAYVDNDGSYTNTDAPVIAIKYGESGFYPIYTKTNAEALNRAAGVTPQQREAMLIGSMFGWDAPGANPNHAAHAGAV